MKWAITGRRGFRVLAGVVSSGRMLESRSIEVGQISVMLARVLGLYMTIFPLAEPERRQPIFEI